MLVNLDGIFARRALVHGGGNTGSSELQWNLAGELCHDVKFINTYRYMSGHVLKVRIIQSFHNWIVYTLMQNLIQAHFQPL